MLFSASLACANYLNLENDIQCLIDGGIGMIHLDVMDGHYVPNLSLNFDIIRSIKEKFPFLKLDVHLMVTNPMDYIKPMAQINADYLTFHHNATHFSYRVISAIKDAGMKAGLAINPSEPLCMIEPVIDVLDMVLLMSIEPGFAGQQFLPLTYSKILSLSQKKEKNSLDLIINVDGGINIDNGIKCKHAGANCLVLGVFAVFNQPQGITQACRDFILAIQK
jgi:ribulose-phosphate 3-epimerase